MREIASQNNVRVRLSIRRKADAFKHKFGHGL
jgi:hypothetical protein